MSNKVDSNGAATGKNNLVNLANRPPDERRKIARMGGLARQENQQRNKHLTNALRALAEMDLPPAMRKNYKLGDWPLTMMEGLAVMLFSKALAGDFRAVREIRMVIGYDDSSEKDFLAEARRILNGVAEAVAMDDY